MLPRIPDDPSASDELGRTTLMLADDAPTTIVPVVPAAARPSLGRALLPWAVFALVAVVVIGGAVAWAETLRGPQPAAPTVLGEPAAVTAAPAAPATTTAAAAPHARPAPTARRTAPAARRTAVKVTRPAVPVAPVAPAPAPAARTAAVATTTPAPEPEWPFGPVYSAGCADPVIAADDPTCRYESSDRP